jgi:succinoglycan biosynthesis protein ExoL
MSVAARLRERQLDAPVIAFFGHDAREPTVVKRITAFMAEGCWVVGFTFQRERHAIGPAAAPAWTNVDLGFTVDRNYLRRIPRLFLAVLRVLAQRDHLHRVDVLYARNIDQALIACAVRRLARLHVPLVYEVLDVQRVFTRPGLLGWAFRFAERRILARSALLVISSPRFLTSYFRPVQNYAGPWYLLENKVAPGGGLPAVLRPPAPPPWVIGWSGVLRCRRSLSILVEIAARLGQRVRVVLRGRLSPCDISADDLAAASSRCPNLVFNGSYANPADLAAVYGAVHFTWAVDYTDAGFNSDWLIPNRIYEGGFHGAVMLARSGAATGDLVEKLGLGWTFQEPLADGVVAFLEQLAPDAYEAARSRVEATPRSCFVDEKDTAGLLARTGVSIPRQSRGLYFGSRSIRLGGVGDGPVLMEPP